jgi:hypothetical protein
MRDYLSKSLKYSEYLALIDELLAQGKTTGAEQSESMLEYAKLNRQRMRRIEKTMVIGPEVGGALVANRRPMVWLVLTEGWCGDAAQAIPVIERIAALARNIETRYVLRDENPALMDAYLTNGARSIPKLIALDAESFEVLGTWGPRPYAAVEYFVKMKNEGLEKAQISENLQRWYNDDKTRSIQREFADLIAEWNSGRSAAAGC